ncbi:MAG: MotA/TolQ/ExbB proton channel family protein [SAR86 cluster bacterium]|uniref:MotA/TolQ/ExbB proton channel family protein n=1 Tax=SAR86 cluster bacterium TaxID=2030880 RepID=A0A972VYR3_9GAMM|nr:MotA/TolQ/ExbB proton channel family protein [SAR86 cluster bacterium]
MRSYLLVLRFAVFNVAALALLVVVWLEGWITLVIESDITRITSGIALIFAVGWLICAHRIFRCSHELNAAVNPDSAAPSRALWYRDLVDKARPDGRSAIADCLRSRLYARVVVVRTIANTLITLGLIGTVIGFIIALSGVDANAVADVGAIGPMVSTLIKGMAVALYTTLVGSVLHVWLLVNYQLLATGTVNLANAIIERAESPEHFSDTLVTTGHA